MRAAVYVRLSKEDRQGARSGIESCLVQQKNAERAIESQAWHLAADRVFVDDDESGAEILRRPKLQAMLLAAGRRTFDVLVLRDLDRLARDAARQAALLVQLKDAGVEVWSYTERAFVQLDGYGYLLTAVKGVVAEQERAKAAQRIREGLRFRVQAGRRATRAPFGYRNIRDARGAAHWQIDDTLAAIVVRVGETFVERSGSFHATAVALNGAGVPSPGGSTWSPQAVKNLLTHPLYRGEYRHGAMRTVARGGTLVRVRAPEAEVLHIAHPELRIWPDSLLAQIDAALSRGRAGRPGARPRRGIWLPPFSGARSAARASSSRAPRDATTSRTSATSIACTAVRPAAASATVRNTRSTRPCFERSRPSSTATSRSARWVCSRTTSKRKPKTMVAIPCATESGETWKRRSARRGTWPTRSRAAARWTRSLSPCERRPAVSTVSEPTSSALTMQLPSPSTRNASSPRRASASPPSRSCCGAGASRPDPSSRPSSVTNGSSPRPSRSRARGAGSSQGKSRRDT